MVSIIGGYVPSSACLTPPENALPILARCSSPDLDPPAREEVVVRRYLLKADSPSSQGSPRQLAFTDAGAAPKPPGASLCGSVFEATLRLRQQVAVDGAAHPDGGSNARVFVQQLLSEAAAGAQPGETAADPQLVASADQAVACLQQLLGMMRVLAPPVRLLMRLTDVALQASRADVCRCSVPLLH